MSYWNSHEYSSRVRVARRDYRCDVCHQIVRKGEKYDSTYGGIGHEHHDKSVTIAGLRATGPTCAVRNSAAN
jgi:hypothetical protein